MDLDEIKEIIKKSGGKFIIVENGNPEIVILSFEDFKKDLERLNSEPFEKKVKSEIVNQSETKPKIAKELEKNYNQPILPASSVIQKTNQIPKELEEEPLKLEDLPF